MDTHRGTRSFFRRVSSLDPFFGCALLVLVILLIYVIVGNSYTYYDALVFIATVVGLGTIAAFLVLMSIRQVLARQIRSES